MGLVAESSAIKTLLEAVEVDSVAVFQQVLEAPPESADVFTGYPSAYFVYDTYESDYSTNEENRRLTVWSIYIYSYTKSLDAEAHFAKMYKIIDATIQKLDESYDLDGACDFVTPVPGELDRVDTETGVGLLANIRLRCWSDVDVRV